MSTKRLATDAMFLTLALVVSYIEVLIPVPVGIPGVKLGLANGVIMVLLFFTTWTRTLDLSDPSCTGRILIWKSNDDRLQSGRRDLKSGHHGTSKEDRRILTHWNQRWRRSSA